MHQGPMGNFPAVRLRRLRRAPWMRGLVAEYRLQPSDFIWPLFLREGDGPAEPVAAMPGVDRLSIAQAVDAAEEAAALGIPAIALFPATPAEKKTDDGREAWNPDNLICRAIRALKAEVPQIGLIADVALDPYTTHGQDGLVEDGVILNDSTLEALNRQALTLARAGADVIAPSDMMDGRIQSLRAALDGAGFTDVALLSYAVKYASAFYGPFRQAVGSAAHLQGDKKTYQMNPANAREGLREARLDIQEGADMLMVKPGMPYLDIVRRLADATDLPVLAYQVSGEYAMLRALSGGDAASYRALMLESLLGFKRAGASAILTYAAPDAARWLADVR